MDRRRFLAAAAGGGVAAALGGCASLAAVRVRPSGGRIRLDLGEHPDLAEPGGFLRIRLEETQELFYVIAGEDGGFAALSPICTHQGCTVDVRGSRLVCPCHGSTYRSDGTVVRGPARRPLTRLPTRVMDDGILEIDVEAGGGGSDI